MSTHSTKTLYTPHSGDDANQLAYFPVCRNLAYKTAVDARNALPASGFGKYAKPPRQPLLIAGEFADGRGFLKLRTHDGSLISPADVNKECWAVHYPAPYSMQIQPLLSYFDSVLKPFAGCRDIILRYQSTAESRLLLEYSTGSALVQCDLNLFFTDAHLQYAGCVIGQQFAKRGEWWQ